MPFNINFSEIVVLLVIAVILFGPDKLPGLARKTARLIAYLRRVVNETQASVKKETGIDPADLDPRHIVTRLMADPELKEVIDSAVEAQVALKTAGLNLQTATADIQATVTGQAGQAGSAPTPSGTGPASPPASPPAPAPNPARARAGGPRPRDRHARLATPRHPRASVAPRPGLGGRRRRRSA
ncbi:MAG: twin-arginine translocase TatA/TatE family subunit [Propionibacteriaceae bacterium]|jgi:sec-independent protein translocase protein TatB|nr:twin-arginine translocase TatA/TatE family subunit [Propionibacteriaceae bacterium]